ncbi:MAG: hypothetical protein QOH06_1779 [Acidobacteriota bacterium]|jgi:hypothetical protein|nr:hypothetical protein [Acidobacteriota bacterium]
MLRKVGLLALVLALTLLVSRGAQAMPLAGSTRAAESHGILDRFWDWIESFFQSHSASKGQPKSIWAQDGSHIDPNGGPH